MTPKILSKSILRMSMSILFERILGVQASSYVVFGSYKKPCISKTVHHDIGKNPKNLHKILSIFEIHCIFLNIHIKSAKNPRISNFFGPNLKAFFIVYSSFHFVSLCGSSDHKTLMFQKFLLILINPV